MELWSNVIALIVCSCFSCDGKMMKVIYCLIRYEPTGFFLKLYMSTNTAWSLFTLSQARAACGTQSFTRWLQLSLWGFTDWALRVEIGNEPLAGCKKPSPFASSICGDLYCYQMDVLFHRFCLQTRSTANILFFIFPTKSFHVIY